MKNFYSDTQYAEKIMSSKPWREEVELFGSILLQSSKIKCTFAPLNEQRGVAQSGSAPGLGPGGRRFESCHPDKKRPITTKEGGCRSLSILRLYMLDVLRINCIFAYRCDTLIIML